MEFFTRLSKNYFFFKNKKEYSSWTQWQGDLSPLDNINNYDTIFNNFGNHIDVTELINYKSSKKKWTVTNGINCCNHWQHAQAKGYQELISNIKKLFNDNVSDFDKKHLEIPNMLKLYGEEFNDNKIIPPIFYKFGINLQTIINTYKKLNEKPKIALEIGSGYGGFCHLTMKYFKNIKYVIVDIQPGMSFASYFLHKLGYKIQFANEFTNFADFINSDNNILFLTPIQMKEIPDNSIDLIINMDSIVEMGEESIKMYIEQMNRLTNHFIFSNNATNHGYQRFINNSLQIMSPKFDMMTSKSICVEPYSHLSFEMTISNNYWNNIFINKKLI